VRKAGWGLGKRARASSELGLPAARDFTDRRTSRTREDHTCRPGGLRDVDRQHTPPVETLITIISLS
jgi:hypothetical protein